VDDLGEASERGVVAEVVVVDQDFEAAQSIAMGIRRAGRIEAVGVLLDGDRKHLVG
jgi:hypothetical protein